MLREIFRNFFVRTTFSTEERYLVAVSGGKDSMALAELFHEAGIYMEVAHANFQLRGEEALGDEALVQSYCHARGIPFHARRFETKKFAAQEGISTQMAARELRYTWFKELLAERQLRAVAFAHHRQDNLETFFLNISKGTGPKGLLGIPEYSSWLIRPLLHAGPEAILHYLKSRETAWREDASNRDSHYQRNRIRLEVLPALKEINPGLEHTFEQNQDRFRQLYAIYAQAEHVFRNMLQAQNQDTFVPDSALNLPGGPLLLEEYLKPKNFTPAQVHTVYSGVSKGKFLLSDTHRFTREKNGWLLQKLEEEYAIHLSIPAPGQYETKLGILEIEGNYKGPIDFSDPKCIFLDGDKIQWPLQLRNRKAGDRFRPYGMKGSKLISDYLKDAQRTVRERQEQLVLEDRANILWLVGERSSELAKICASTTAILRVDFRKIN